MRWLGDCLIVGLLVLTACTQSHMVTQTYCLAPRSDLDGKLPLLDQDYQCKYGFKVGSDLEFTVNSRTNTVLEHVVRNDGNFFKTDIFLSGCEVVDDFNWECRRSGGFCAFHSYPDRQRNDRWNLL